MFDEDDQERMMSNETRVPDGVIDGSAYAEIFVSLHNSLKKMNPDDQYFSHVRWVMECINQCYEFEEGEVAVFVKEKASDVVTALAYFTMTMHSALHQIGVLDQYIDHQEKEVIPQMLKECGAIPWYDFSKDLKNLEESGFLDDIESFLDDSDD
jgi:hypothetical protein